MKREEVKRYWDERAREHNLDPAATTDDVYLRELEITTLIETLEKLPLPEGACVLDVGCGDGYSTARVSASFPEVTFLGVDYSEAMVANAQGRLREAEFPPGQVGFKVGDVTRLRDAVGQELFDAIISDRCLINLDSREVQAVAFARLSDCLKPGGSLIAIENFQEGHDNMNAARRTLGLPEIPVRWHNLYFDEPSLFAMVRPPLKVVSIKDFSSSYYFATRVIYSAMCKELGEPIDYRHPIHRLAPRLPWTGQFSPIRMIIARRYDD